MRITWIAALCLIASACGASVGSGGTGVGMQEGVPSESGAACSDRPAVTECGDGFEVCTVRSELDGCSYQECVSAGSCGG